MRDEGVFLDRNWMSQYPVPAVVGRVLNGIKGVITIMSGWRDPREGKRVKAREGDPASRPSRPLNWNLVPILRA